TLPGSLSVIPPTLLDAHLRTPVCFLLSRLSLMGLSCISTIVPEQLQKDYYWHLWPMIVTWSLAFLSAIPPL
ncbi:Olfactory Receptor 2L2, partial [Manis pentadactyla]